MTTASPGSRPETGLEPHARRDLKSADKGSTLSLRWNGSPVTLDVSQVRTKQRTGHRCLDYRPMEPQSMQFSAAVFETICYKPREN